MNIDARAVAAWSRLELLMPLVGGARNPVFLARRDRHQLVVRLSSRSPASLDWELDLLDYLGRHGIRVPSLVPTDDGHRHRRGVVVQRFLPGRPPRTRMEWQRVIEVVVTVHQLTLGWPQRPGFASSRQLLTTEHGGDVRLDVLPTEAVHAVRTSWRRILSGPESVVHGDVRAKNILVDGTDVALLDWDESRVDVRGFDFAFLPKEIEIPFPVNRCALITAGLAWDVAACWTWAPEYAAQCLDEVYARLSRRDSQREL